MTMRSQPRLEPHVTCNIKHRAGEAYSAGWLQATAASPFVNVTTIKIAAREGADDKLLGWK